MSGFGSERHISKAMGSAGTSCKLEGTDRHGKDVFSYAKRSRMAAHSDARAISHHAWAWNGGARKLRVAPGKATGQIHLRRLRSGSVRSEAQIREWDGMAELQRSH